MKLKRFEHLEVYRFMLTFENGEIKQADLQELIGAYVVPDALPTARINPEWECLEFNDGKVDIEPKTLYRYAAAADSRQAA